ncbi:MAG: NADH:flavin oxidoreductase/NADH oxidase [Ignavibacteria bacterium]|jgi:2,4-dienoyl-CoA reductase-like NADH-dependent reductase (Old Yellow Enzyme family)|nr:NADH:flavin oxidoreductase/NADH oxidase [Ignavibacteria bacterium]MCU7501772.1 NADH:flavin oxidoreductase/NADH oxidase [Ignavibacteria bacterium]MCU7516821.1 NADH:flavin oxidoreductase/NADH oxidase [Ignavibacteria bacterium]
MESKLFSPLRIRGLEFKNRIFVSPMCQYSSQDGLANSWHLVHLGSRAIGGSALVITEAASVSKEGRISPGDIGIWSDRHAEALRPITDFIRSQNARAGIQIAHAGRKASTSSPFNGGGPLKANGWQTIAPSAIAFDSNYPVPKEMDNHDIEGVLDEFKNAAHLSLKAGFEVAELHFAHGYLMHEFLSPLSNKRTDEFGGSLENRMRFPLMVAKAVREIWPGEMPVFVRISATDWVEGGWDIIQSIEFAKKLKDTGIDLIDCSSGALIPHVKIPSAPGYQVPFAEAIKKETGILTGAVGMITDPQQAEEIVSSDRADAVLIARELLRNPYWPLYAASKLGSEIAWPVQYERAKFSTRVR